MAGIIVAEGGARSRCIIRNLSRNGAQVEAADGSPLPMTFTLEFGHVGPGHEARVAWRLPDRAGVTFSAPRDAPPVFPG